VEDLCQLIANITNSKFPNRAIKLYLK
jgi:hypothetical protein